MRIAAMRAFAAFPAARLRGKRDLALFFKGNVTQTKSLMRTVMGHARRETVAFRQRRAGDTARWRERVRCGSGGVSIEVDDMTFDLKARIHPLLSGLNRIYRLYREEGLAVRKRRSRRKAVGTRAPILVEARPNARWSLDFVHDQLAYGRRFRILNIVDDVTRECLAAIPDTSISDALPANSAPSSTGVANLGCRQNLNVRGAATIWP
jgi:hypothetical protein